MNERTPALGVTLSDGERVSAFIEGGRVRVVIDGDEQTGTLSNVTEVRGGYWVTFVPDDPQG